MSDLDLVGERTRHALERIGDEYAPTVTLERVMTAARSETKAPVVALSAESRRSGSRSRWVASFAAVSLIAVGIGVAWEARPDGSRGTTPDQDIDDEIAALTPTEVAVLEPAPGATGPQQSSPYASWVQQAGDEVVRTFVHLGDDGFPTATISLTESASGYPPRALDLMPAEDIDGVDARLVMDDYWSSTIAWVSGAGITQVSGRGEATLDVVRSYAQLAAAAGRVDEAPVPSGYTEPPMSTIAGVTNYGATARLELHRTERGATHGALANLPVAGRTSTPGSSQGLYVDPIPGGTGWLFEGDGIARGAIVVIDEQHWVRVTGAGVDEIEDLAARVQVVPATSIPVMPIGQAYGLPAATTVLEAGEFAFGRLLALSYESPQRGSCIQLQSYAQFVHGSTACGDTVQGLAACWTTRWPTSQSTANSYAFLAWINDDVDSIAVSIDGEPADAIVEHIGGLTLAGGIQQHAISDIAATADGQPICS